MLELAILGLLKEQDLHGYELKKRLGEALGPFARVSFGSLYPALNRLQRGGAVQTLTRSELARSEGEGEGEGDTTSIPATGSMAGEAAAFRAGRGRGTSTRAGRNRPARVRKVYRITTRGQELFAELLSAETTGEDDRAFSLRLAFCRYMDPEERMTLLERRRAHLLDRLAAARASNRRWRDHLDRYTRSLMEHDTESTERDISWLDGLIATERDLGRRAANGDETGSTRTPTAVATERGPGQE